MIVYYRVDQRVVHGQTVTVLLTQYQSDGILIVDDEIAHDEFLKTTFKAAVQGQLKVLAFTVEGAMRKLVEAEESQKKYFVIFKTVDSLKRMIEGGYRLKEPLYLGIQHARDNTKFIDSGLCLTDQEIEDLNWMQSQGLEIRVNPRVNQKWKTWDEVYSSIK